MCVHGGRDYNTRFQTSGTVFIMYGSVKTLYCASKTNRALYVHYIGIKIFKEI